MANGMNWAAHQYRGRPTEAARPRAEPKRGAQTHVKREMVREFTEAEKAQWTAANPALLQPTTARPVRSAGTYETWCYRTALEKVIVDTNPTLFVTLVFNQGTSLNGAKAKLRAFQARMDRATIGPAWQASAERSRFIAIAENLTRNLHLHIAMCVAPEHCDAFQRLAPSIWAKLVPDGSVDAQRVWSASGLADYITKQITPDESDRIIHSENA